MINLTNHPIRCTALLLVLCFISICKSFSQEYQEPKVIPPSPEAGNLGKYGEFPVSYNTGTPEIDIPLCEITAEDIKLPISISYHAGGNKVTDVASWVGLGWALNAGGVISRTMRGQPDESTNGYFNKWSEWQTKKNWPPPSPIDPTGQRFQKHFFQTQVARGIYDLSPDIFTFNFGSYSGRILFDQNRNPVIIPYQDLKIEHPFDAFGANRWVITTPEGLVFTFGSSHAEFTTPMDVSEGSPGPFYSSWYLTSITSLKSNAVISFNYETVILGGIETSPSNGVLITRRGLQPPEPCQDNPPYAVAQSNSEYMISTKVLSGIIFPKGYVAFGSSSDRQDYYQDVIYNGKRLSNIVVAYDGSVPFSKEFIFSQTYFGAGAAKRLRLDQVLETGKNPYKFEYNTTPLPIPTSVERDHWGYYNASGNSTLIPALTPSELQIYNYNPSASANRSANPSGSKACILEKIIYPTGGYTKFNFEGHEYNDMIQSTQYYSTTASGGSLKENMNEYEQGLYDFYLNNGTQHGGSSNSIFISSEIITLNTAKSVTISHSISGSIQSIAETRIYQLPILNYDQPLYFNSNSTELLQAGTYVLISSASIQGTTVYSGMNYLYEYGGKVNAGGVRIAQMQNFDGINTYTKNFNYNLADGTSSSELFFMPTYKKVTPCLELYVSSNNIDIPSTHQGLHIGYKQVTVTDEGGQNGKTVYKFLNSINDIERDLVTGEITYNAAGNVVKSVAYEYSPSMFSSFSPIVMMKMTQHHYNSSFEYYDFLVTDQQYATFFTYQNKITEKIYSGTTPLITEQTIKQGREPSFESEGHTLLTEKITTTSDGQRIIQKFINSGDPDPNADNPPAIKVPVKIITIKEDASHEKWLVGAMRTRYDGFIPNLPKDVQFFEGFPVKYEENMNIDFVTKYKFTNNVHKKVIKRKGADGIVTAYLWDSDNINPIASVVNGLNDSIAYTSFENASNEGSWSFTFNSGYEGKTGARSHKFTSSPISRALIPLEKGYKISFWMKNGSPTITTNVDVTSPNPVYTDANNWKLYEYYTTENVNNVAISAPQCVGETCTLIDELRLHPVGAQMTTYTHKPGEGISSITDPNNQTSYFNYDGVGRLIEVKDANLDILKFYQYNFKN